MGISEKRQCYVYGQCQVYSSESGLVISFHYIIFLHRDTQSISSNGMMQNPATCFAAKMKTASGGHSSHPDRCAWPLKTAQSLGIQMLDHVLIASVESDCKLTNANFKLHHSRVFYPLTVALQGNVLPQPNVMVIWLIPFPWHI